MHFQQLKYFVDVADSKSINKSAHNLYITQSALTRSMHSLEEALGVELLHKDKKGVELTANGKVFYKYAVQALADFENMKRNLTVSRDEHNLSVSIPHNGNYKQAVRLLHRFLEEVPEITINGKQYWYFDTAIEELINERTEFMIGSSLAVLQHHPQYGQCEYMPIADFEWVLYMAANNNLADKDVISLTEDCEGKIFYVNIAAQNSWIKESNPRNQTYAIESGNDMILNLLEHNDYCLFLGPSGLRHDSETIICRPIAETISQDQYVMIWKKDRKQTNLMKKFRKFAEQQTEYQQN